MPPAFNLSMAPGQGQGMFSSVLCGRVYYYSCIALFAMAPGQGLFSSVLWGRVYYYSCIDSLAMAPGQVGCPARCCGVGFTMTPA